MIVSRTCTEIPTGDADRHRLGESQSRPLEEFRDTPAYVLVGDPGAGKTTAFQMECEALGDDACKIPARDFLTFDLQHHPEWRGKTLFIDGLDEIRAGTSDVRTPLDEVRRRLDTLGKPRFRLSCREADWLGENDRKHLESVSPDSGVKVLRLDSLADEDVVSILDARPDIPDADAFIKAAEKGRVEGLLPNPQTLEMLADVVGAGEGWPESRMQTFEMACSQMVREHNDEHAAAQEPDGPPAPDQLLDAGGRLCALQLISGGSGYTLRGEPDEEHPALEECEYDSQLLRLALATKLFKGASSNRFTPVHRHIAEYLGARHLAGAIERDLPARRVIALMAGGDGTVVTEMRGLSAWLATHSRDARADLIERDPIGVGLYGDIGKYSNGEKRALLESLNREGSRLGPLRTAAAFRALAAPELETVLREILDRSDRTPDHQMLTDFVLRVLNEGSALPGLSGILLDIVRDHTRWPRVTASAIKAFIHNRPDSQDKVNELSQLLSDIRSGRVSDPDNELLGFLLYELYPCDLSPSQVWGIRLETSHRDSHFGMYWGFFCFGLLQKSSDDQVAQLLDTLGDRIDMRPTLKSSSTWENLPARLLARGLQAHGDQLATERLYDWLDLGFGEDLDEPPIGDREDIHEIRSWLDLRPDLQKAIYLEGLSRCRASDEFRFHAYNVRDRLYGASPPSDFGLWCLKQSVAMADEKPLAAGHLLEVAFRAHTDQTANAGLSLEVLREHTQRDETLKAHLDRLLAPPSSTPRQQKWRERAGTFAEERRLREEQWLELIRSNEVALRENRAAPALLHQIAIRYFGNSIDVHRQGGPKEMEKELEDPNLIDAALMGIRGVIYRKDLPEVEDILALRATDRMHYLGSPLLAALSEIERRSLEEFCRLDVDQIRKALAFHFTSSSNEPSWYRRLLDSNPGIVADAMIHSGKAELRGSGRITGLFPLAHSESHAQVARHASLPLLRAFPTRCKLSQIENLKHLLWGAFQFADRPALQELIATKLSRKSMNDTQRVRWLAVAVMVSPTRYKVILNDFAKGNRRRISNLAEFFCLRDPMQFSFGDLGVPVLELLIGLVGSYVGPDQRRGDDADDGKGGVVGPEMEAAWLVYRLIHRLAASPTQEATDALARLAGDPDLSGWQDELPHAQETQRVIGRDTSYQHPDIAQVCRTLNSGTPANAADLTALLMDLLQKLGEDIRTGNTDDWRQYWNVDSHGRPVDSRPEGSCRDALLSALRHWLPPSVDAQPEGQYAKDKRADIRVSCGDFQVPVEVKKNLHRDLWSAPRNQLIAKYTTDPATGGYGIYLVFWFGKEVTPSPPTGDRPATADELQGRLHATLTPVEARKISICVVDVNRPDA